MGYTGVLSMRLAPAACPRLSLPAGGLSTVAGMQAAPSGTSASSVQIQDANSLGPELLQACQLAIAQVLGLH